MGRLIVSAQMTVVCVMDPIEEWFDPTLEKEMASRNCVPQTRLSSDARLTKS